MGSLSAFMRDVFGMFMYLLLILVGIWLYLAAQYYVPKYIDEVVNPAIISSHLEFTQAVETMFDYLIPIFFP